ncbi:MAG: LysR substrate-binding domain-containing protein [Rhodospirillaceae bacterium]|nr:LysR substrate-binding domain-containing protein [Rhodospirillaceae bacterium]
MSKSSTGGFRRKLPPLECLRYFETAARHESFVRAARELGVTPAAVYYRVNVLEEHLGQTLFMRKRRSVSLNTRGKACLRDVQRVLAEIGLINERYGFERPSRRIGIAAVEPIAERWLMPRLAGFTALEPDIAIEIETNVAGADPNGVDVDLWITYAGEAGAPSAPEAQHETLFEETLLPACSPALIAKNSRPSRAADLHGWPLLCHLSRRTDWHNWFSVHKTMVPDLTRASGFSLFSMVVQAAVEGMGMAIGSTSTMEREFRRGSLVALFDDDIGPRMNCCLVSTAASRSRSEVRAFRDWIFKESSAQRTEPVVDRR